MSQADFGLVGLAVMGENLVLNVESRGYTCAVYNRTTSKVDNFMRHGERFWRSEWSYVSVGCLFGAKLLKRAAVRPSKFH